MWFLLLLSLAHASDTPASSDIQVKALVDLPVDVLHSALSDFKTWEELFPDDCVTDWAHGSTTQGAEARSRVTYQMAGMKRRLTATFKKTDDPRYIDVDHPEKKGFVTRWLFTPTEAGTEVRLETYIQAPPWPFRSYYFNKVKPAWTACYTRTLQRLPEVIKP